MFVVQSREIGDSTKSYLAQRGQIRAIGADEVISVNLLRTESPEPLS